MIVLKSVTKYFGHGRRRRYVLVDADAVFEAKNSYVIFSASKGGKSTVLSLLSGIQRPNRGSILRHGRVGLPIGLGGLFSARYSGREVAASLSSLYGADE